MGEDNEEQREGASSDEKEINWRRPRNEKQEKKGAERGYRRYIFPFLFL